MQLQNLILNFVLQRGINAMLNRKIKATTKTKIFILFLINQGYNFL